MASIEGKSLSTPDETRTPDKSLIEVVHVGGAEVGRFTFQPGWRWSECVKPVVGTDTCQAEHLGYVVSGSIGVTHGDGTKVELGAGDAYHIAPGHDAWVIGDQQFVGVEFKSAATYAKA
jgi:quercetin dioxygenase-like cupin family protein